MIDKSFIRKTLARLVQINSVNPGLEKGSPGESEIGEFIFSVLYSEGIDAEIEKLAPGRVNVIGRVKGNGGRSLMLNAHMDTVGVTGMSEPFSGRIEDGKLYGRGSYDMKGSIAAILGAAKAIKDQKLKPHGDLILSFVADEEYESIGARALVKKIKTDAAIVTEPTELNICLAHRGFGVYKITTKGKTAHGGNHKVGIDANLSMGSLLVELGKLSKRLPKEKKHWLCGEASMHVPLINGGRSLFIYSNECTIHVERRTIPGETAEGVELELNGIIRESQESDPQYRAEIERVIWRSPYEIDQSASIVIDIEKAISLVSNRKPAFIGHSWWEDSAIFGDAGIETVVLGPKGGGIHEEIEWVDLNSVYELSEILAQVALRSSSVTSKNKINSLG